MFIPIDVNGKRIKQTVSSSAYVKGRSHKTADFEQSAVSLHECVLYADS